MHRHRCTSFTLTGTFWLGRLLCGYSYSLLFRSAGERKKFTRRSSIGGERGDADEEAKFDALLASEDSLFGGASSVITSETDDVIFFSNWNTALFVQVRLVVRHSS